ncbi:MAG TPA: hypothetical protein VIL05_09630 [Thermoclostridium sp.]
MKRFLSVLISLLLLMSPVFAAENENALQPVRVALIDTGISPVAIDISRIAEGKNYAIPDFTLLLNKIKIQIYLLP